MSKKKFLKLKSKYFYLLCLGKEKKAVKVKNKMLKAILERRREGKKVSMFNYH